MLLILSNSQDATVAYLVPHLETASIPYVRIDTDTILDDLRFTFTPSEPILNFGGGSYSPNDFEVIWYRRPESLVSKIANGTPESKYGLDEWTEALEGFLAHVPVTKWMNHPSANAFASHKIEQLSTALRLGFLIPPSLVTQNADSLKEFYSQHSGKIIAKPLSTGLIEEPDTGTVSLIYTSRVRESDLQYLQDLNVCPTLFQKELDKEFDVRITVVDKSIHAVKLRAVDSPRSQRLDIRRDNMHDVDYETCELPPEVTSLILALMNYYGLRFAAIDMAVTKSGEWHYFEINPNGQWAWLDTAAGLNIASSFLRSFKN